MKTTNQNRYEKNKELLGLISQWESICGKKSNLTYSFIVDRCDNNDIDRLIPCVQTYISSAQLK